MSPRVSWRSRTGPSRRRGITLCGVACVPRAPTRAPFPLDSPQQVTFDLLPTSVLFRAGDRIRIAIAAADPDSFQLMPANGVASYRIGHGGSRPSFAELPVIG
jgi:predicted acyl esterase